MTDSSLSQDDKDESKTIEVRGFSPETSNDCIEYYFDNPRRGGGEIADLRRKNDVIYITFVNAEVVEQVLQHPGGHKLDGATLNVSIYHEGLGTGGGVYDPTRVKKPDPITITNLDKYKLALIKEDRHARTFFEKYFHSEFSWVKGDDITVSLKCIPTKEVSDVQRCFFKWSANVESALKEYLKLLKIEEMDVPRGIWDEVHQKLNIGQIDGACLFDCKDSSQLVVVGFAGQSKSLAEKVKTVIKKVEEEYERRKEEVSETVNQVNSLQLCLLLASGFPKQMKQKYPDLTVTIKLPKTEISFVGIIADVKNAQIEMYELLQSKKLSRVTDFSADQLQMVDKKCVRDYVVRKIKRKNLVGVWEVTDKDVAILALSDHDAVHVANIIKQSVVEKICKLEPESLMLLSSDKWSNLISGLSQSHGDFLHVAQWETGNVVITATDDIMANVSEDIINFFTENTIFVQTVSFPKGIQRFLQEYCDEDISEITRNLKQLKVQISYSKTGEQFTINATRFGMDAAMKALENLASKVNHRMFLHKRPGLQKLLKSQKGIQFVNSLERSEKSIIEKSFDSSEKMSVGSKHVMETTAVADFFSSGSKPQKEDNSFEMQLHYFSDNLLSIDASILAVESYCGEEIIRKVVADESFQRLKKSQMKKIFDLQDQFSVRVMLSEKRDMITIEGLHVDVYNAYEVVQKLLREFDHLEAEQDMATILSNIIQWYYIEVDQQGQTKQVEYDKKVNGIIEKAYRDKQRSVSLEASGQKYIIDFNTMEEYPENDRNDRVKVVRKDLMKVSAFEVPSHWTPMGEDEDLRVVTLQTSDADYQGVSQEFLNSVQQRTAKIIKIERIQNKTLYQQYVAKKKQITKQSSQPAERKLWHGTSSDAIVSLNTHGFNRSYCGKNATLFGDGVYFAVNAIYSARNTWSRPDSQGYKHIYYASVLTGDFTKGQQGMRIPPVKSPNQALLYDSVVDNVANPGTYIIFNDTQAYPDYLITFTL